ncbi:MAG: hypothetical protein KJ749_04855 [Planctomycetes bacterium]|nr:hypothetical protein [Planctomycetota bacterium]
MFSCIAVVAPVYLSEEEALQIITEELTQSGIKPQQPESRLAGVSSRLDRLLADVKITARHVDYPYDWIS